MTNADRTGPERDHILSREERIRTMTAREVKYRRELWNVAGRSVRREKPALPL